MYLFVIVIVNDGHLTGLPGRLELTKIKLLTPGDTISIAPENSCKKKKKIRI